MPNKRHHDAAVRSLSGEKMQRKNERSHEENQERAYIAASRRQDRSIEARVQSARMASEIHKKRTGKGFKISEEIVMQEEMYEEEDDDLPRSYRMLNSAMVTNSAMMNKRLQAYLTTQVAMHSMADARKAEVDRLFAEEFPNAAQVSQQLQQSLYYQPLQGDGASDASPTVSHAPPYNYASPPHHSYVRDRSQSIASGHRQTEEHFSTPDLSPGSGSNSATPQSSSTPVFTTAYTDAGSMPVDPLINSTPTTSSSFTAELPAEVKDLATIDMNDYIANSFYGAPEDMMAADAYYGMPNESHEYFNPVQAMRQTASRIGTPGGGDGDTWEAWVHTDDWNSDAAAVGKLELPNNMEF